MQVIGLQLHDTRISCPPAAGPLPATSTAFLCSFTAFRCPPRKQAARHGSSQAKPVNYTGHFHSASDPLLEKVWWTAAWTVRSNLLAKYFGSILMDRGDRESWTGDAHPAQASTATHELKQKSVIRTIGPWSIPIIRNMPDRRRSDWVCSDNCGVSPL